MSARGVVAAGHPATAEAGAWALREGGNAVDAAVAAVLLSFASESQMTGFGAGGFMLVHDGDANELIDFFVEVPGSNGVERSSELVAAPVYFTEAVPQTFHIGAASCGVPGLAAGLEKAIERHGSMPLAALVEPALAAARDGVVVNSLQAYIYKLLDPVVRFEPEIAEIYVPGGTMLEEGDTFRFPDLAEALERFAEEGSEPFYRGDIAERVCDWVLERGGTLSLEDMAGYEAVVREPVRASFGGREVLTNPPPSSGGILIAFALELLDRIGECDPAQLVAVMAEAQAARGENFSLGLLEDGFATGFLAAERLDQAARNAATRLASGSLEPGGPGSTTHITAVDADGRCATVTCSNGVGSGLVVPGTGVHLNNMLGEEDLNPRGFHTAPSGTRLPSMMSPTVILRDGELEAGLGSAGSNRIRSAIVQIVLRLIADGMPVQEAVDAPRIHFEAGILHVEPGIDMAAFAHFREIEIEPWEERNLYFGGSQVVSRDAAGAIAWGGDPRRGGAVAVA